MKNRSLAMVLTLSNRGLREKKTHSSRGKRDHLEHVTPQTPPRDPGNEVLQACYICDSNYILFWNKRKHDGPEVDSLRSKRSCAFLAKGKPRNLSRSASERDFWVFLSPKTHMNACYAGYQVEEVSPGRKQTKSYTHYLV